MNTNAPATLSKNAHAYRLSLLSVCFCFKRHLFISLEKQNKDATDTKGAYKLPHHFI